jgi:tRNA dimethylallyltransferase
MSVGQKALNQRSAVVPGGESVAPGRVIGVLGPTGVGKTAVAAAMARMLGTRIISCDSMQVYAGFPVLTNQPAAGGGGSEQHELVGFVDPAKPFSAGEYAEAARPLIRKDLAGYGYALVVGGSGLYMRAALAPLAALRAGDLELRKWLEVRAQSEGVDPLHKELAQHDAEAARSVDPRNVRRVIRALESVLTSNRPWSGRDDLWAPAYDHPTVIVGLVLDREELSRRIAARTARMMETGAVEEVRRFREERGVEAAKSGRPGICSAIGYPEICRHLDGKQTRAETVEQIAAATRRYARRQLTWLRKVRAAVMMDVQGKEAAEIALDILDLASFNESRKESREP